MVALVCILHSLGQAILESGGVSQQRFRLCNGFRPQALRLHRTKLPQERRPLFGGDVATHVADHVPELVRGERTQLGFQFLRKRFQRKPGCILHIQQNGAKRSSCKITHNDFEPGVPTYWECLFWRPAQQSDGTMINLIANPNVGIGLPTLGIWPSSRRPTFRNSCQVTRPRGHPGRQCQPPSPRVPAAHRRTYLDRLSTRRASNHERGSLPEVILLDLCGAPAQQPKAAGSQ